MSITVRAHFDLELQGEGAQRKPVLWMGLGQVRDLRSNTIAAIQAARSERPFADLADLLRRVALQGKEAMHLIRCGALDGLGSSRAGLLAELARYERGGLAQMGFAFLAEETAAETAAERLAWEEQVLGLPVSEHPLAALVRHRQGLSVSEFLAQVLGGSRHKAGTPREGANRHGSRSPAAGLDRRDGLFPERRTQLPGGGRPARAASAACRGKPSKL